MTKHTYQIKAVADIAGVSQRTLRHYDDIGLLKPSLRSAAGYRLYTDLDLLRLQQIMLGRALGMALENIRELIDDPSLDRRSLLIRQKHQLSERVAATEKMIRSIDAALALLDTHVSEEASAMNMTDIFDGFDPKQYEAEAEQRWGNTDAYAESARRTRRYTESDWRAIKQASEQILQDAIELLQSKVPPADARAMDIAERYRLWVDRWFYACPPSMHARLGGMYQGDSRFAAYFDERAPGLAAFISAAILANTERNQTGSK